MKTRLEISCHHCGKTIPSSETRARGRALNLDSPIHLTSVTELQTKLDNMEALLKAFTMTNKVRQLPVSDPMPVNQTQYHCGHNPHLGYSTQLLLLCLWQVYFGFLALFRTYNHTYCYPPDVESENWYATLQNLREPGPVYNTEYVWPKHVRKTQTPHNVTTDINSRTQSGLRVHPLSFIQD